MGVDINMHIVKNGEIKAKNIFDGRNSEWFDNISRSNYRDDDYRDFPVCFKISKQAPKKEGFIQEDLEKDGYYGFSTVNVGKFREWFNKYRPDKKAGWVTTYDKWRIENKGYIPEDVQTCLSKDDIIEDMHFIEYINKYDCSKWLYDFLEDNAIDDDADITYWFDC